MQRHGLIGGAYSLLQAAGRADAEQRSHEQAQV
jgi:hypothetical protein